MQKIQNHSGFTLVELIVVITILAILWTIGFISVQWYLASARDSSRISDLTNISKGLGNYFIQNKTLPFPDGSSITIYASGISIGSQWYAGSNTLGAIKMNDAKDPLDKKYYTYLTNSDNTKYQILALFEDSNTSAVSGVFWVVDTAHAGYETRFPGTKGSPLGIFLSNTGMTINQPIQESYSASFTGVDIITATGWFYKAILSKDRILMGTGLVFWELYGRLDGTVGTYPWCDTPDTKLPNGQVWATCNAGATTGWTGWLSYNTSIGSATDYNPQLRSTLGGVYQWGRNEDVTNLASGSTLAPRGSPSTVILGKFITGSWWAVTWSNPPLWGGEWTGTGGWLYSEKYFTDQKSMQWPCESGYHIPTIKEWCNAAMTIDPSIVTSCLLPQDWTNAINTVSVLKLPLAGYRSRNDSLFKNQGVEWYYWSSSPSSTAWGLGVTFKAWSIYFWNPYICYGHSVRCLRN